MSLNLDDLFDEDEDGMVNLFSENLGYTYRIFSFILAIRLDFWVNYPEISL